MNEVYIHLGDCRRKSVSIDKVGFEFEVLEAADEEKSHTGGKVIYGLQLEGARWAEERGELDEALPKVQIRGVLGHAILKYSIFGILTSSYQTWTAFFDWGLLKPVKLHMKLGLMVF